MVELFCCAVDGEPEVLGWWEAVGFEDCEDGAAVVFDLFCGRWFCWEDVMWVGPAEGC